MRSKGDYLRAVLFFEKAMEVDPDGKENLTLRRGAAFLYAGQVSKATVDINEACKNNATA